MRVRLAESDEDWRLVKNAVDIDITACGGEAFKSVKDLEEYVDADDIGPVLVEADGKPIGAAVFHEKTLPTFPAPAVDIIIFSVLPEFKEKNAEVDCLDAVVEWTRSKRKNATIEIFTTASNENAISTYEKSGFEKAYSGMNGLGLQFIAYKNIPSKTLKIED